MDLFQLEVLGVRARLVIWVGRLLALAIVTSLIKVWLNAKNCLPTCTSEGVHVHPNSRSVVDSFQLPVVLLLVRDDMAAVGSVLKFLFDYVIRLI